MNNPENHYSYNKFTKKAKASRGTRARHIRLCSQYHIDFVLSKETASMLLNVAKQAEQKERADRKKLKALNKPIKDRSPDYRQSKPMQKSLWDLIGDNYKKEVKRRKLQSIADKTAFKTAKSATLEKKSSFNKRNVKAAA